jgi:hypothetical protein
MHIDVVFIAERLGSPGDEGIFTVDQTGDVVGNASGRIRSMAAAFENRYVHFGLQPADLRCGAHARRIATYYDEHILLPFACRTGNRRTAIPERHGGYRPDCFVLRVEKSECHCTTLL